MPFVTDPTWTPATYRRAYAAWRANAPGTDGPIMPRDAHTTSPRHKGLSEKLKGLLTWRAATRPDAPLTTSWMRGDIKPDNDNFDDDEYEPQPLDCEIEMRPSINEMWREWLGPEDHPTIYRDLPVAEAVRVPVAGDITHGEQRDVPEYIASESEGERAPRRDRRIVTGIGRLEFSNGEQVEKCTVLKMKKPLEGEVRLPAGALVRYKGRKPVDSFRGAKGALPDTDFTVGIGGHNPGVGLCPDPVVDHEWARTIRALVGEETASVLDLAITAANFREIGEAEGKQGKHAERAGKATVIAACERLDAVISVNDNYWIKQRKIA